MDARSLLILSACLLAAGSVPVICSQEGLGNAISAAATPQAVAVEGFGAASGLSAPGRALAESTRQPAASPSRFADDIVPEPVLASWRPQAARSADALTSADLGGYGYGSYGYGYGGYGTYGGSSNNDPTTVTPPANTVPYSFHIRFVGMDCSALLGNAAKLLAFKFNVRSAVAKAAGLNVANFRVGNVSCGSVVFDLVVDTPATWSPAQISTFAEQIASSPQSVFTADFLAAYPDIAGFEVTITSELPPVPAGGLSEEAKIGVGVGVGVGGAAIVTGTAGLIIMRRRRRAAVEPRNELGADVPPAEDEA